MAQGVLAAAPPRFVIAGHSMGGYVALEIMRRAPERVSGLALINTSARSDSPEHISRRSDLMSLAQVGRFHGVTPRLFPQLVADPSAEKLEILQHMAAEVGVAHFLDQQQAIMSRIDSRSGLAAIKCPTLIIGGRDDRLTPPDLSIEMFNRISDSELHIIRRCGHLAPLEAPGEVAYFLQNLWSLSEI
jgi:pimeloyl-ACP methyl ester carboxylesterase